MRVKRFIEATGLTLSDTFTGLPDHISAEFELMQRLAQEESRAWREGTEDEARWCLKVQRKFFEEHLLKWVPVFCDKVVGAAEMAFFREMATMTKAFLSFERANLGGDPEKADAAG